MDLSAVVAAFASSVTVTRRAAATFTDATGDASLPSSSTLAVLACAQAATGRDMSRLPEGLRSSEARVFFTTTQLFTKTDAQEPDVITYRGEDYQVQNVERWDDLGNYWRVVASRVT